jgi:hypothetical protein
VAHAGTCRIYGEGGDAIVPSGALGARAVIARMVIDGITDMRESPVPMVGGRRETNRMLIFGFSISTTS